MPEASNDLIIMWYTAWQNPVENSVYSMGDITALIPGGTIDICILEEPEHLNWYVWSLLGSRILLLVLKTHCENFLCRYRAPGENWTEKFKHVVGILHTNYFQYALDQPAALIRVCSCFLCWFVCCE